MRNRFSLDGLYQRFVKGVLLCLRAFDNDYVQINKHKLSTSAYINGIVSNKILGRECAMFRASSFVTYMLTSYISDAFESSRLAIFRLEKVIPSQ